MNMNMDKKEYVDSVMRVLGNSSIELYTYEYDVFQSELESEYDKVFSRSTKTVFPKCPRCKSEDLYPTAFFGRKKKD